MRPDRIDPLRRRTERGEEAPDVIREFAVCRGLGDGLLRIGGRGRQAKHGRRRTRGRQSQRGDRRRSTASILTQH